MMQAGLEPTSAQGQTLAVGKETDLLLAVCGPAMPELSYTAPLQQLNLEHAQHQRPGSSRSILHAAQLRSN